jgi:hypothetical protein
MKESKGDLLPFYLLPILLTLRKLLFSGGQMAFARGAKNLLLHALGKRSPRTRVTRAIERKQKPKSGPEFFPFFFAFSG